VQLLGDNFGKVVALGERDCSVQRRHQKLVEEAPAPGLSREQRLGLHEMAVRVAATVGLRNAATAEFLLTTEGEFWFLEVNARLQVEHGVTELVADLDLVHEQLWIASGRRLSDSVYRAAETAADPYRHAIEVRVSAEHPALHFAPAPGRITRWRVPGGPGVRVDDGVEEGSVVSEHYDPLVAKLMVVAADRPGALSRLARALEEFEIGGIQTTLPFHRWLLEQPAFTEVSGLATDLVDRSWQPTELISAAALRAAELAAQAAIAGPGEMGLAEVRNGHADDAWWLAGIAEATDTSDGSHPTGRRG
jgi:acetyl/propionyl-CoA carboxylase alpha subunit